MNITQQQRQDLTLAVVAGEHQIDADCIRLHRDPTQEGSALSQLVDRVVAVIEQSTAQPQAVVPADQRPVNCGTGYCSCIECVVEPTAQAERAPVVQAVQAREYPPLPWGNQQPYVWFCRTKDTDLVAAFRAYVDADRASSGATPAAQPTTLQAHTRAVGEWLSELYAVMVDPCAEGQTTPQAMCEAIMAAALQARELAAVTPADVRMLTPREIELLREIRLHAQFGLNEGWQREARNLLLELEQYYRTIPPSGEIGGV